jgi:hypothetical protein
MIVKSTDSGETVIDFIIGDWYYEIKKKW